MPTPTDYYHHRRCILPLFYLTQFSILFSSAISSTNTTAELTALIHLRSSLSTPPQNSDLFSTWLPNASSPCSFTGVTCDPASTTVTSINLSNRNLSSTSQLPLDILCTNLPSLHTLVFGFNSLSGKIHTKLNTCQNLRYLDLGNNQFTGEFPDISSLTKLDHLYLNLTGLTGRFPWTSLPELANLQTLSIGDNSFDITPFPAEVTRLLNLTVLYMTNCSISGSIPSTIGDLTKLTSLELSSNHLSGNIPPEITNLKKLSQLQLYDNTLTGTIPTGFGELTNLLYFDASNNSLHGDISELRTLTSLITVQLFENHFTGSVPPEFGEFRNLINLSLYTNNFTGSLPQKLGSWSDFELIDVSTNSFTGGIPPDMCKFGKMIKLLMLQNKFTGEIPKSYANCTTLLRFRVSDNLLTGTVPAGIWGLPDAEIIDVADNSLSGVITKDIGMAKKLGIFLAGNNKLSGNLPEEISGALRLDTIDIQNNKLDGPLPGSIGKLKSLNNLYLENNKLSGDMPDTLGGCVRLSSLNLAGNELSGSIPASLGLVDSLYSLNLSRNELTGNIPDTLTSNKLSLLDISYNQLTGPIPDSLPVSVYKNFFSGNPGLCSNDGTVENFIPCPRTRPHNSNVFIICFTLGSVLLIILCGFYAYLKIKSSRKERSPSLRDDHSWDMKSYHVVSFTEDQILDAIKQDNLIGTGGCGNVYKVALRDGKALAVKHIWTFNPNDQTMTRPGTPMLSRSRRSKEFDTEVKLLSSIRHVNVVKLFCSITSEDSSLLVYEYLPNGSLWDRLHTGNKLMMTLDWGTRYEIAIGAARGLEYLHQGCERPVIHRDIKSSNILLDEFLKPKIADFGLAKIVQAATPSVVGKDSTHVIAGTHGYIAPEYGYTYRVTEKSDVYSFGVVLMELVTGKKPIDPEFGDNKDIVSWVSRNLKSKDKVLNIVDSRIPEKLKEEAIKVLKIAILCTASLPDMRPSMRSVVQMLEDADPCRLVSVVVTKEGSDKKEECT